MKYIYSIFAFISSLIAIFLYGRKTGITSEKIKYKDAVNTGLNEVKKANENVHAITQNQVKTEDNIRNDGSLDSMDNILSGKDN